MAEKSGLFNSVDGDKRSYQDADFAQMMSLFVGRSGYIPNYLNELEVVEGDSSLSVKVSYGAAWLGVNPGWWYINSEGAPEEDFSYYDPEATGTADYRIILELEREEARSIIARSVAYSDSLDGDINTYKIPLAKVSVDWDAPSITITDERIPCVLSTSGIAEKSEEWTLSFSDINKFIKCTNTGAINVTVPLNENIQLPINTEVVICQFVDQAEITVLPENDDVTVNSLDGALTTDGQYSAFTLRKIDTDEWIAIGALTS